MVSRHGRACHGHDESLGFAPEVSRGATLSLEGSLDHRGVGRHLRRDRAAVGKRRRDRGGAGMYVPFDSRNIDLDGFHRTMALNVYGVINGVAAVLPAMLARKSGHIAIMGSLFGYAGWPENGSYGASKAAVINLAESLKLELTGTGEFELQTL